MTFRVFLAALALTIAVPASAQSSVAPPPSIVVEGHASSDVVPDTATVSLGVVTERPRAGDAVTENAKAVAGVVASIKAAGIDPKDITTTEIGLSPVEDRPKPGPVPGAPQIVAYRASNLLSFKARIADGLGGLLAKLVDGGANAIDGLSFSNADEAALRDGLKAEAARDARHQAEIYASALGLKLGRVLSVTPGQEQGFQPRVMGLMKASAPVPIEAGQRRIAETVSVTFALGE